MRHAILAVVLSVPVLALSVSCDREPANPAPPAAPTAPAVPAPQAARAPDSHPAVAAELLKAATDLNAALAGINSDADAKAAEPKLRELAERHEALAATAKRLPPPTAETDQAIRARVQGPLQKEAGSVRGHLDRLRPVGSITQVVMPYIARIGQASQVVAVTSHVDSRPQPDDDGSPEAIQRMAEQAELYKDIVVPAPMRNTPLGWRYAANAAPLVRKHGADRVAVVVFNQVSSTDRVFIPLIEAAVKSLKLESSVPTVAPFGPSLTDVYVVVAPVDDLKDLASRLTEVIPDSRTSLKPAERIITVSTESTKADLSKRAARLTELGGSPAQP